MELGNTFLLPPVLLISVRFTWDEVTSRERARVVPITS